MARKAAERSYRTVQDCVTFRGVGVHTGTETTVTIHPSDHGITLSKSDHKGISVNASIENVLDTVHGTSIGNGQIRFQMVEHLLATLYAMEIDGAHIIVENGDELPIMDGSALPLVQVLKRTKVINREGIEPTGSVVVRTPFHMSEGNSYLAVYPAPECTISYFINYKDYPELTQLRTAEVGPSIFETEIAPARTYAFFEWIEPLKRQGLIKGGSLENSLVYSKDGFMNPGPLRFRDELVRHKILDFIGDLSLYGSRIQGHFMIICGGHTAHISFLKALKEHLSTCEKGN